MENLAAVWRDLFTSADGLGPNAPAEEKRSRGRQFERILLGMLAEAGLQPRIRFRPAGEEIDGSFFHRGRVLLLEAKWTEGPQPASSIYQFRGKDGKLVGTIGVFISMSGYSKDAVDALIAGKVLNVILFSDDDMRAVAEGQIGFAEALDRKLRDAAEAGTPFSPLRDPASRQPLDRRYGPGGPRAVIVEGAVRRRPRPCTGRRAGRPELPTSGRPGRRDGEPGRAGERGLQRGMGRLGADHRRRRRPA